MKTPLIALAATATLIAGTPALAVETGDNMVVQYQDLNLSSVKGQKTLERRIDAAAKRYCRVGAQRSGTRISNSQASKCYREAKRLARQQFAEVIDNNRLGG
ncbi:UrcA family protein [Parerythrobacter jejuensis]|uniref:UrcA family protein n=1 Tax=Parerythrobacter jejuensis TaxID=795812 RepID=A0A845AQ19_9SPHN|nr:UrcA family protein [Parerythrobacter jejuensis]MXP30971.1 UrcA family protein [Parerythrobacter jejuensis]MXP33731.1 UrcA family protein [Parerythrobacter jejuensis]